jgi:hypothetical protein
VNPSLALLLFVFAAVVDVLWVRYTLAVTERQALRAATVGSLIYLFGAVGTVKYVQQPWYLAPLIAGAFTGTFFTLKWGGAKCAGF